MVSLDGMLQNSMDLVILVCPYLAQHGVVKVLTQGECENPKNNGDYDLIFVTLRLRVYSPLELGVLSKHPTLFSVLSAKQVYV